MGANPQPTQELNIDSITLTPSSLARWTTRGQWQLHPHIELIEKAVLDLIFNDDHDVLVLSVPPQHGKSEYISGWLVKWMMGTFPRKRLALVSYAAKVAKKWGESARNFFQAHGRELFGLDVSTSKKAADNWIFDDALFEDIESWNPEGGYQPGSMMTTGTGGALTGQPVDFGIIDDPIKNAEQAASESFREKLIEWYGTVFLTRLSKGAKHVIIATRWHDGDLSGYIQANCGGPRVKFLNLAAICPSEEEVAEEDLPLFFPDPLGRKAGEALCPALHDIDQLRQQEATLTAYNFWALYQGCPRPGKGGWVDYNDFAFYERHETLLTHDVKANRYVYKDPSVRYDDLVQSWDTKLSRKTNKKRKGSFVVGQVWGRIGRKAYLLYQVRGRWGIDDTIAKIKDVSMMFPDALVKLVEPKASGPEIVERLEGEIMGLEMFPVEGDKLTRALSVEHWFKSRGIWVPKKADAHWVASWMYEIRSFPNCVTDDQVDATSQVLKYFERRIGLMVAPERADQLPPRDKMGIRMVNHEG